MSTEIIYRAMDYENYDDCRMDALTHRYSWRDSDPEGYVEITEDQLENRIQSFMKMFKEESGQYMGFGAFFGGEIIGGHQLEIQNIDGKKACHIHGLWVDKKFHKQGIAKKLKSMGEKWAIEKECIFMDSNVKVTNDSMISLNKKLEYQIARYNFRKFL